MTSGPPSGEDPTRRSAGPSWLMDGWEYVLPMAVFLLFIQFGAWFEGSAPWMYVGRTVVVTALIWVLWKAYTKIRWTHKGLGVLVGVIGVVQWVGMEKLLLWGGQRVPLLQWTSMASPADAFNPLEYFASYPPWVLYAWLAIRLAGSSLLVPVMEELFWRDWCWRSAASPNNFRLVPVGEYDRSAFWVIPLIFAVVHVQWLTAIVWALMIAWLLVRTRSLGACIIAHGVTNLLLGAYVLVTRDWYFW